MSDLQRLKDGITALNLTLPDDAPEKLLAYRDLLLKWNKTYNLTALKNPAEAITHHLLDSLAILPAIDQVMGTPPFLPPCGGGCPQGRRGEAAVQQETTLVSAELPPLPTLRATLSHEGRGEKDAAASPQVTNLSSVLDVGSGGGLPGIPLAIARPELHITLTDAVQKKTAFLQQVVIELGLAHVEVRHSRVENLAGRYDLITSRAFAELADFVVLTRHLIAPGGYWLAMKGQYPEAELAALTQSAADIRVKAVEPLKVPGLDGERHLVILQTAD
jgi:16S rRNA (guanine527-N7)-methyltransferase